MNPFHDVPIFSLLIILSNIICSDNFHMVKYIAISCI